MTDKKVFVYCASGGDGDARWLDGHISDSTVGVAENIPHFSGTSWIMTKEQSGTHTLEKADAGGAGDRFLDGHTGDRTLGLADRSSGGFTGTHWQMIPAGGAAGGVHLRCAAVPGDDYWLDGHTGNGGIGLAENTKDFPGTRWYILEREL